MPRPPCILCVALQANNQLDGALEHLSALGSAPLDTKALEEASGIGILVSMLTACSKVCSNQSGEQKLRAAIDDDAGGIPGGKSY